MRVLQVAPSLSLSWGGPAAVVSNLGQTLAKKGVATTVVTTRGTRGGVNPVDLAGVETRAFPTGVLGKLWTGYSPALAKSLRKMVGEFDVVHIHELWNHPHFAAYQAANRFRKPYIVSVHGNLGSWAMGHKGLRKRLYFAAIQRRMLNHASALHALTQEEKRQIDAQRLVPPVKVISNGIDLQEFQTFPPRDEFGNKYPQTLGKTVCLFLGRIHPIKGLDLLANAFAQVRQSHKAAFLVIVGPDEMGYRARLEALVYELGVAKDILFTGPLVGRDKLAALIAADVFVLPSYSEGFSVTVLEAMAASLPVVVSRQCFFPEAARAGAGLEVETNANALAGALAQLLDQPQRRREMGEQGRRLVTERYTWDRIVDQMLELYQWVIEQHKAGTPAVQVSESG